jgi:hypothetical protein
MYDIFIKAFRDEISSTKITEIPSRLLEDYREFIDMNMLKYAVAGKPETQYFDEALRLSMNDAEKLAAIRLVKKLFGATRVESDTDNTVFKILSRLVTFYAGLLDGRIMREGDKLLVELSKPLQYNGMTILPGTLTSMGLDEAVPYIIKGDAVMVFRPYYEEIISKEER